MNHFLNQPEKLTLEKEQKWYELCYLVDDTQGYMVAVDKMTGEPFATQGWTDMDRENRRCIAGRLLLGDDKYKNSSQFAETFFLLGDYLYQYVDIMYAHIGIENGKSIHVSEMMGYHLNKGEIQYPSECFVQGNKSRPQNEYIRTQEDYERAKKFLAKGMELLDVVNEIREDKGEKRISELAPDMQLRKDLAFDSLDLAVMTAKIEEKYGVDVFEDGIVNTLDDVMKKLEKK